MLHVNRLGSIDRSRRRFLSAATALAGDAVLHRSAGFALTTDQQQQIETKPDYSLTIATQPIELAPNRIVSVTAYNAQFPGPLLRFKEGVRVMVDVHNDSDTPEQLHWHGQSIPPDVDGAAEEGTPFIPPHGSRRISFVPRPAGFRFYHTHVRAGVDLSLGQYSGLVGPVYIEPAYNPGRYDREVFLTLKEFQPTLPGLWLGTAERISAIVEMKHPGVWVMGDTSDDDRRHGMGIVVEYGGRSDKPQWIAPPPFHWNYARFGQTEGKAQAPDEVIDLTFAKDNAALDGFNRWTINGASYPLAQMMAEPSFHLKEGKRYRLRMRNASDDIHPIHLHRHTFDAGQPTSGVLKYVVMVDGYQETEIDFTADNPGLTLFHCHQQLHMDYGFMSLFDFAG